MDFIAPVAQTLNGQQTVVVRSELENPDLLLKPELLRAARTYFGEQTKETKWQPLIPEGTTAPIDLNKEKMERFRPDLRKLRYDPSKYSTYLDQLHIHYPTVH